MLQCGRQATTRPDNFQGNLMFHQHSGTPIDMYFQRVAAVSVQLGIVLFLGDDFPGAAENGYAENMVSRFNGTTETQSISAMRRLQRSRQKKVVIGVDRESLFPHIRHDRNVQRSLSRGWGVRIRQGPSRRGRSFRAFRSGVARNRWFMSHGGRPCHLLRKISVRNNHLRGLTVKSCVRGWFRGGACLKNRNIGTQRSGAVLSRRVAWRRGLGREGRKHDRRCGRRSHGAQPGRCRGHGGPG